MKYFTFQPQFHDHIRSLIKTSTIRPKQKVNVGERFALRHWKGAPYRSKVGWLGTAVCVHVARIHMVIVAGNEVAIDGEELNDAQLERFAIQEGFAGSSDMARWFYDNHKMPFSGILTRWDPASFVAGDPS